MASIAFLLNPVEDPNLYQQLPSPCSTYYSPTPRPKKQKVSKDAPVFVKGQVRGELRYPPYEYQDEELRQAHELFKLHPMGRISEFPRHIPYNSDKKPFMGATGRGGFDVFQYTFTMPQTGKTYTVMWDYNIGLVRTTAFFKCNGYGKTTPAKMLNANKGLKSICYSITGGALAAQGYWVPYEAAKAVAATFCWDIRYVLTPVFGIDFPSLCRPRTDKNFGVMDVSQDIILQATETARRYRLLENPQPKAAIPSPRTPRHSHEYYGNNDAYATQSQQMEEMAGPEGGDEICTSPIPRWSKWTPANMPQSDKSLPVRLPPFRDLFGKPSSARVGDPRLPTASPAPAFVSKARRKTVAAKKDLENGMQVAPVHTSPYVQNRKMLPDQYSSNMEESNGHGDMHGGWRDVAEDDSEDGDDDYDYDRYEENGPYSEDSSLGSESEWEQEHQRTLERDTKAAHLLMNLYTEDAEKGGNEDDDLSDRKRRRASS
ncbi:hypothetical protein FQN54_004533 [Arachnomyces sp. PD_36]|nr:hypothetical protein FQN54_004533 [Arachnomyces sp. PD_36]